MGRDRTKLHEDLITICYYISDYGYGHATRSIAIIRTILERHQDAPIRLIVNCGKALPFLIDSLQSQMMPAISQDHHIEFRSIFSDTGYVLHNDSIAADIQGLRQQYNLDMSLFEERITQEQQFLENVQAQLVISDISPIPFVAAQRTGVESLGISNFTWYTAYQDMLDKSDLNQLREAYAQMDHFISLAGCAEPQWGRKCRIDTGFFCRQPDLQEVERIRTALDPTGKRKIIFFGLGRSIQVDHWSTMELWDSEDCVFIVSSNMDIDHPNVVQIPDQYTESQNYVAAANLVITKPGWGTVCEAIELAKPLILLNRSHFYEDRHTIAAVPVDHPLYLMSWEEIQQLTFAAEDRIDELEHSPPSKVSSTDHHVSSSTLIEIADYIQNLLHHVKVV
ncbi:glycosyltransferase [Paenibacillus kyungheensis]|uniref:Glycosyltransferase n=1 Tax=Paenibacillus kyungheensis TaxID=1452732 RepID=A0AAX3M4X1_9BACL|nr:glycosyltransferase [Paenibacillus kyungheensis]WCT56413.1 glycosyltransferase [Paenibacillus kyungheensis]